MTSRMSRLGLGTLLAAVAVTAAAAASHAAPVPQAPACPMFPADSHWHADVSHLPVHPSSGPYVASAGAGGSMHADFGSGVWEGGPIGIPYTTVGSGQAKVPVSFYYADESDPGPYPVPPDAPIEGGPDSDGDRHVLVVDRDACRLYELYDARRQGDGSWQAGSGAVYDMRSNALRPAGWTSADAAGLPVLPGLVRYDEVASGRIDHAIRITVNATDARYLWPARHQAGSANASRAPMGLRLRLKAGVDISRYPPQAQVVLQALKTYGAIVADNGTSWYITGVPDERWDNDALHTLGAIHGSDFEAVDASSLMADPNSGRVAGGNPGPAPAPSPGPATTHRPSSRPTTPSAAPATTAPTAVAPPTSTSMPDPTTSTTAADEVALDTSGPLDGDSGVSRGWIALALLLLGGVGTPALVLGMKAPRNPGRFHPRFGGGRVTPPG